MSERQPFRWDRLDDALTDYDDLGFYHRYILWQGHHEKYTVDVPLDIEEHIAAKALREDASVHTRFWHSLYDNVTQVATYWRIRSIRLEAELKRRMMAADCRDFDGFVNGDLQCDGGPEPSCGYHREAYTRAMEATVRDATERLAGLGLS